MFKRYGEVMLRLEELGARAGKLSNNDRHELQSLLEEQAWLGSTIVKKAKSVLEEIDGTFEKLFDWMIDVSDLIDLAAGESGTPEDLLELEKMMSDAVNLRDQMRRLNLDKRIVRTAAKRAGRSIQAARTEAAPATVPVLDDLQMSMPEPAEAGDDKFQHPPMDNTPVDDTEPPVTLVTVESPISSVTVEPIALVPARKNGLAQKKSRKKKVKKTKLSAGDQYHPPEELLLAIAQKITPQEQLKYPFSLPGDNDKFISFGLPERGK